MITGETIQNSDIIALRESTQRVLSSMTTSVATYDEYCRLSSTVHSCRVALGEKRARRGDSRAKARARCAAILNQRANHDAQSGGG